MQNHLRKPNFFIIGAPKCGTTSLSSWLSSHPNIFMCKPKEPYFFSTDIHCISAVKNQEDYKRLFKDVTDSHTVIGDASTTYLRSRVAVPSILELYPDAIFIVCLRNPVEMVASVHMQLFKVRLETERSLEKAWALQDLRKKGQCLPTFCPEPTNLQYGEVCLLGEQVKRLLNKVPRHRVLFVFLEDLRNQPQKEYQRVLSFLDIPDDNRHDFSPQNQRAEPKLLFVANTIRRFIHIKSYLGIKKSFGLGTIVNKINTKRISTVHEYSHEFLTDLQKYFTSDIEKLSNLVDRDLSKWLQP
jgi:hypothetical protein